MSHFPQFFCKIFSPHLSPFWPSNTKLLCNSLLDALKSWRKLNSSLVIVWLIIIIIFNSIFIILSAVVIRSATGRASAVSAQGNELFLGSNGTTLPPGRLDLFSIGDDCNIVELTNTKTQLWMKYKHGKQWGYKCWHTYFSLHCQLSVWCRRTEISKLNAEY